MLPGLNGLEVCRRIRAGSTVPIIIVSARATDADKVLGLEAGADDYLAKPFLLGELRARIHAVLRRASPP
jgi:DNA-binding response OmpR family regulator